MHKKRIFIPIETKVREFHGKLFFSLVAAEKGFEVFLGGQRELQAGIAQYSPGIYLDKSIADTKRHWFHHARSFGNSMCTWDEEGLVVFDVETYFRLRICRELFNELRFFFAWGDSEANAIRSRIPGAEDKVRATGNPRFDLLRLEMRPFFDDSVASLRRSFGRILLVNTNFAFANFFLGEEKVQEVYRAYTISEQPGFFEGWAEAQRVSLEAFCDIIPKISRRYPDHTVVIRPHPSENFSLWRDLSSDLTNVIVNGEGNVHEWILASELLMHFNCTTGIEAFFLDVPAVSFHMPGQEDFHQPLPNQLSLQCRDPEQLLDLAEDIIRGGSDYPRLAETPERVKIAREHVTGMEGAYASERIVDALLDVEIAAESQAALVEPQVPVAKRIWRQVLALMRRPDPKDSAYALQKFPGLSLQEVHSCVLRFRQITDRFEGIRIRNVGPHCFRFERD